MDLDINRFLNVLTYWATKDAEDPNDVDKWTRRLWMPPAGVATDVGPWSPEAERQALSDVKAQLEGV